MFFSLMSWPPVNPPQPEVQTLSTVTVSESSSNSVRVSWGPLLPHLIQGYQLEYSALPTGPLRVVSVSNRQNSTVLTGLQPDTQYLVTVSARQASGRERAMTVKVCTQEGKNPQIVISSSLHFPFGVKLHIAVIWIYVCFLKLKQLYNSKVF